MIKGVLDTCSILQLPLSKYTNIPLRFRSLTTDLRDISPTFESSTPGLVDAGL